MHRLSSDGKALFMYRATEFPIAEWDRFMTDLTKRGLEVTSDEPYRTEVTHDRVVTDYYHTRPIETDPR